MSDKKVRPLISACDKPRFIAFTAWPQAREPDCDMGVKNGANGKTIYMQNLEPTSINQFLSLIETTKTNEWFLQ